MTTGIGRKIALAIIPFLGEMFVRLWFSTCRFREHNIEWRRQLEEEGKPIVGVSWHYCVLGVFAICRNVPLVFMISASNDGDLLSRTAERLGFSVVRGSRNRRGASAAKELIKELRRGKNGALIADGSQGPARKAQSGPVLLAARSGGSILPMLYSATRYYRFKTWDRLILPKLFSRIDIVYGKPIVVPEDVKSGNLEEYRNMVETGLNEVYREAWELQGKTSH
jgi:lysophospholipid acyltransferase (LPLAT)-like uncharacterized protein